jgi:hypothetical protein
MAISASDFLNVAPSKFAATGAFDPVLNVDSLLFLDPLLLRKTKVPEFKNSYAKLEARFKALGKLLAHSRAVGDAFWRQAERLFVFPEVEGLCIGYSSSGTGGAGFGGGLRRTVLETGKAIIDGGTHDAEIFELMGLFEKGVGRDRISDMVARVVITDIADYTARVWERLGITTTPLILEKTQINSVLNPFNQKPLLLVPRSLLRDLPIAHSWDDIAFAAAANQETREYLNKVVGAEWRDQRFTKNDLRKLVLEYPGLMVELVKTYRAAKPTEYDYDRDPSGEVVWYRASRNAANSFPLALTLPTNPSEHDILKVVLAIGAHFKQLIENNGLNGLLFDGEKPKHESASQKLFFGIADSYCEANNLDLSRESNAGRGPVDFKVSKGYRNRVVVETKLSVNKRLMHGVTTQIEEYQKAEKSSLAVYIVIDVGGSRKQLNELKAYILSQKAKKSLRLPEVIFVDGRPKPSASKA